MLGQLTRGGVEQIGGDFARYEMDGVGSGEGKQGVVDLFLGDAQARCYLALVDVDIVGKEACVGAQV